MGEEEEQQQNQEPEKAAESEAPSVLAPAAEQAPVEEEKRVSVKEQKEEVPFDDIAKEKTIDPVPEKIVGFVTEKSSKVSTQGRDAVLAKVEAEKTFALIKAWEENEKAKVDNKAHKKFSAIEAWENTKKAAVEAQLKKFEEKMEKKKAEYAEKKKNRIAEIHKAAEEKRAVIEAQRGEEFIKAEETAVKYRASGYVPKKFLGCFSG